MVCGGVCSGLAVRKEGSGLKLRSCDLREMACSWTMCWLQDTCLHLVTADGRRR